MWKNIHIYEELIKPVFGSIESMRGALALVEGSDSVDAVEKALAGLVTGLQAARHDGLPEFVPGTTSMGELFNDVFTRLDPMSAKGLAALTRSDITVETLQAALDASSPILQSCRALSGRIVEAGRCSDGLPDCTQPQVERMHRCCAVHDWFRGAALACSTKDADSKACATLLGDLDRILKEG